MSEPQPPDWENWIDWSNVDLLDACYDPMLGMDPDSIQSQDGNLAGILLYTPIETIYQFGHNPSSMENEPINDRRTEIEKCAFENNNIANEVYGTTEDALATMTGATLPIQERLGLYEDSPAVIQKPTTANITDRKDEGRCNECGETFRGRGWLRSYYKGSHARQTGHLAYTCKVTECKRTFVDEQERYAHELRPHVLGHGRAQTTTPFDCFACKTTLRSKADLLRHGKEFQHQPYACECGILFSRLDVLNRHLESFGIDDPKYPCKYCKRHRGAEGFRRLDHLNQHVRNYHHHEMDKEPIEQKAKTTRLKYSFPICPHSDCPQYRDGSFKELPHRIQAQQKPFESQSAYTKHMREVHNECTFPCDVAGCDRVGRRGYFREKDLLKHRRDQHQDASAYEVTKRDLRIRCTEEGCSALLDLSSMKQHISWMHRAS